MPIMLNGPRLLLALAAALSGGFVAPSFTSAQGVQGSGEPAVFVLDGGGRLRGVFLDRQATAQGRRIGILADTRTDAKFEMTLPENRVWSMNRTSPERVKYETLRHHAPDTVEGQWDLARWCSDNRLTAEQQTHLARVIQLDPDHVEARTALGFRRSGGAWLTRDEEMTSLGMVLFKGSYRTQQEVEIFEAAESRDANEREWVQRLNAWRRALAGRSAPAAQAALDGIRAINDPAAAGALIRHLEDAQTRDEKRLFMDALGRTGSGQAVSMLVDLALFDSDGEVREAALRNLDPLRRPSMQAMLIRELTNGDAEIINRAGEALRRLGDVDAIPALIDSLVTTHRTTVPGRSSGGFDLSFDRNSGNLGAFGVGGSGPTHFDQTYRNSRVLSALVSLSGGENFQYDEGAWRQWYASTQSVAAGSLRRD